MDANRFTRLSLVTINPARDRVMIDLAYATGTLLGAAKVQWEPLASPGDFQ